MNFGPGQPLACPECGATHYFCDRKIFTSYVQNGKHVTRDTGSECICLNPKCRCHFATTEGGIIRLEPVMQYQNVASVPAEEPLNGEPKIRRGIIPRERQAGV